MFEVAKNYKQVDDSPSSRAPGISPPVEANTREWRERVKEELKRRPRGAQAALARHLKISTGHLSGILADDKYPGEKRHSQHVAEISAYLWPAENNDIHPLMRRFLRSISTEEQRAMAERVLDDEALRLLLLKSGKK